MIIKLGELDGDPDVCLGVEGYILQYLKAYGEIVSLDRWAHKHGLTPWWVRQCAHNAAAKKQVQLTRMPSLRGNPYKVTLLEERHE